MVRAQGKSPAQVVQRWAWQQNIVLNPRTHNIKYMKENLEIFRWTAGYFLDVKG